VIVKVCASGVLSASQFAGDSLGTRWPVLIHFHACPHPHEPANQTRTSGLSGVTQGLSRLVRRRLHCKAAVSQVLWSALLRFGVTKSSRPTTFLPPPPRKSLLGRAFFQRMGAARMIFGERPYRSRGFLNQTAKAAPSRMNIAIAAPGRDGQQISGAIAFLRPRRLSAKPRSYWRLSRPHRALWSGTCMRSKKMRPMRAGGSTQRVARPSCPPLADSWNVA
jgi:hypothetical protein